MPFQVVAFLHAHCELGVGFLWHVLILVDSQLSEKCFMENTLHGLADHLTTECVLSMCGALGLVSIIKNNQARKKKKLCNIDLFYAIKTHCTGAEEGGSWLSQ